MVSQSLVSMAIAGLVACGIATMPAHAQPAAVPLRDKLAAGEKPVRIVCFGDSITGVYYHTGGKRAYPEMLEIALKRIYPKAKVQVINAGISGHNTRNALARIERDVLKHKPSLVTVMFGMNDLVGVPIAEFKANMEKIIERCRDAKAEVVLCTQNAVLDGTGRTNKKLDEYSAMIRAIAKEHKLAVADCNQGYVDVRSKDAREFRLLMSDEIHPNMDGHKLLAEVIAKTISGKAISLADVPTPRPAIPRTLSRVKAGKTVKVLAMPPYHQAILHALSNLGAQSAEVKVWPTKGQTLAQIEEYARKVRKMDMDLVVIAVPIDAKVASEEELIRAYSWVMNWSLSFAKQEWDCIAIPPSTFLPDKLTEAQWQRDILFRRLIRAQHIDTVLREPGDERSITAILTQWLKEQAKQP